MELAADRGEDYDWLGSSFIRVMVLLSVCGYLFGVTYSRLRVRNPVVNLAGLQGSKLRSRVAGNRHDGLRALRQCGPYPTIRPTAARIYRHVGGSCADARCCGARHDHPSCRKVLSIVPVKYVIAIGGVALSFALVIFKKPDTEYRLLSSGVSIVRARRLRWLCCLCQSALPPILTITKSK